MHKWKVDILYVRNQQHVNTQLNWKLDILSVSNTTENILSVSNPYTTGATLPESQLEMYQWNVSYL